MKVTVVTVCLNAEKTIQKTIESVLNQNYQDIEYIIMDGQSRDGTIDIIKRYQGDLRIKLISERDTGLYNAMNKATQISSGRYICFLNSGDCFCDNSVITDIVPFLDADIVYGNVIRSFQNQKVRETYAGKYKLMRMLMMGKMMSHQSIFTRTNIMQKYRFDEQFRICADFDFIVRAKKNKCSMKYIDRDICIVDNIEGISSQKENYNLMRFEDDKSLKKNMPFWYVIIYLPKNIYRYIRDRLSK